MSLIIDLIIVSLILICVLIYAKRGFVKSVFGVLGFVAAIVLSFAFSSPLANLVYDKAVEPAICSVIETTIHDTTDDINSAVIETLPSFIKNNVDFSNTNLYNPADIDTPKMMAEKICNDFVEPTTLSLLKIIFSIILFVLLSIVIKFVVKLLNRVFSFSIIGKLNATLGGVLGAIIGIVFALLFVLIINLLIAFNGGFWIFTSDIIGSTFLFKQLLQLLPLGI